MRRILENSLKFLNGKVIDPKTNVTWYSALLFLQVIADVLVGRYEIWLILPTLFFSVRLIHFVLVLKANKIHHA